MQRWSRFMDQFIPSKILEKYSLCVETLTRSFFPKMVSQKMLNFYSRCEQSIVWTTRGLYKYILGPKHRISLMIMYQKWLNWKLNKDFNFRSQRWGKKSRIKRKMWQNRFHWSSILPTLAENGMGTNITTWHLGMILISLDSQLKPYSWTLFGPLSLL